MQWMILGRLLHLRIWMVIIEVARLGIKKVTAFVCCTVPITLQNSRNKLEIGLQTPLVLYTFVPFSCFCSLFLFMFFLSLLSACYPIFLPLLSHLLPSWAIEFVAAVDSFFKLYLWLTFSHIIQCSHCPLLASYVK